jgi:signal transduction histidine kinase/CheY-like chemotaxis protein
MSSGDDWKENTDPSGPPGLRSSRTSQIEVDWERADLIALTGELAGRRYTIQHKMMIGRDPAAEVVISTNDVSRRHAVIERSDGGQFVIEDLRSRNGTLVNGVPTELKVLQFGDKIQVGSKSLFVFAHHSDLEEQLVRWQRMELIGQMAGGVVHDLNNCLTVVSGNIQYLEMSTEQGEMVDRETLQHCLTEMASATNQAVNLSRKVLGFARGPASHTTTEISGTIQEALRLVRRNLDPSIIIATRLRPRLDVAGDPTQLLQVVVNLVLNARDAMPDGGRLHITAEEHTLDRDQAAQVGVLSPGKYVVIQVADTGVGMDSATMRRVFEPLFTTKEPDKGTGLGLATVKRIVESAEGQIAVQSEPGRGTTFTIHLPCVREPAAPRTGRSTETRVPEEAPLGEGLVLLLDQDPQVRERLRRILRGIRHDLICATDAADFLQLVETYCDRVQLAIINFDQPDVDADRLCQQMREIDPAVRMLVISGSKDHRTRSIITRGVAGFLLKPYGTRTLRAVIDKALED